MRFGWRVSDLQLMTCSLLERLFLIARVKISNENVSNNCDLWRQTQQQLYVNFLVIIVAFAFMNRRIQQWHIMVTCRGFRSFVFKAQSLRSERGYFPKQPEKRFCKDFLNTIIFFAGRRTFRCVLAFHQQLNINIRSMYLPKTLFKHEGMQTIKRIKFYAVILNTVRERPCENLNNFMICILINYYYSNFTR